ncbi:MAG: antitoxin Xre/MbcA/ParS toxin-binding domain-containing protein [Acetobacteraceae bacterium]
MDAATLPRPVTTDGKREAAVLTRAVLRAAEILALDGRMLAAILGISEATVSRMRGGRYELPRHDKSFELGVLLVRLFRGLDSIVGGDAASARAWLRADNTALGAPPITLLPSITGLLNVVRYLDARRAVL